MTPRYRYKIHDKLYDLTDFVKIHPGGMDMFNHLKLDSNITPMLYLYHKNINTILTLLPKYEVPLTADLIIKYDTNYTYDKYSELKKLVHTEIHEKKIPLYWSNNEIAYNACMFLLYLGIWIYCFWYAINLSYWWMVLLAFMNISYVALVFHETSHYTGFKNQKMNNAISYLIMAPIITTEEWKYEHNYLHHGFTNTVYDSDFEDNKYAIRQAHYHPHYFHHRFQFIYTYALFSLVIFSKGPINSIINKRWNILLFFTVLYKFGYIHAFIMYGLTGILFSLIAQLSHIQYECIQLNTANKNDFLYNQVSSSMNYKTDHLFTRTICFGLDLQIEHHLFPNIPHSSLRKIQHIVRTYCEKNDIPYIEKPSMLHMISSYACYLYNIGQGQLY